MQQVYQQQMESQASLLNTNSSSSTAQTSTETLDMSSLKISENNLAAQESNADTNEDNEKESEDFDENHDTEDHECAEECGFGPDDDGKDEFVYIQLFVYNLTKFYLNFSISCQHVDQKRIKRFQRFNTKRGWGFHH